MKITNLLVQGIINERPPVSKTQAQSTADRPNLNRDNSQAPPAPVQVNWIKIVITKMIVLEILLCKVVSN